MIQEVYHIDDPKSSNDKLSIHPSLVPYFITISFTKLTPAVVRQIVMKNPDRVMGDFVRMSRQKGLLR